MAKLENIILKFFHVAIIVVAVVQCVRLNAQETGNLARFTESDGLPSSQIYEVIIDNFGFVWVGTLNGLARFDGYEFTRFYNNPNDTTSFKGLNVWTIYEDSKGRIWVASGTSYLNVYDPVTRVFRQYEYAHLIDHPANYEVGIATISEDNKGRLYFGVNTNYGDPITTALLFLDETEDKVKSFDGPSTSNINNSVKDIHGNIWLLSKTGLWKIDSTRKLKRIQTPDSVNLKEDEFVSDLATDQKGTLFLITNQYRLLELDNETMKLKIHLIDNYEKKEQNINNTPKIVCDDKDNIWISTAKRLVYFDRQKSDIQVINESANSALVNSSILEMCIDSFGSLWIGTFSGGLFRYDGGTLFKSYSHQGGSENSLTPGWANTVIESSDGNLIIATTGPGDEAGINFMNPLNGSIKAVAFKTFLPDNYSIFGMMEQSSGVLLISTNFGVFHFTPQTMRLRKLKISGVPDTIVINRFYQDSRKNTWLCTYGGLFKKSAGDKSYTKYDLSKIFSANESSNEVLQVVESKKHGLWLLTNHGLFLYHYDNDKIDRHGYDNSKGDIFISQDINSLYEDKNGIAWIGTWQGGLSRYNVETGKIKTYNINDGLPSMSIQGILGDEENNNIWLSTFEGLSRFNTKYENFNNFSIADGIQSQLFADGSMLKTSGGLFIFGGSNGITVFRASDISTNSLPPRVFLTDLKLFNKSVIPGDRSILKRPIYASKQVTLAHDQNTITIEFMALHYSNPSKNKSAYMLENYDNQWNEIGNQRFAFYSKLPPGEYIFHVKSANNNGVWNEEGASIEIVINPPWWKTTWAYIVYIILVLITLFIADRYFRKRLMEKERVHKQAVELAHAKEIEKAYRDLKDTQFKLIQSEKMASLGELTAGIAHEIKNPLNFVNNFSEVNSELIDELQLELKSGNNESAIALANDIRENEQKIAYHGKRADGIVKGMLLHSRSGNGIKELTDINAMAEEYLRLSYHGFRAKDKTCNVNVKTTFDESIGKIYINPQEIGRVILNLLTNAFYSVMEKKKIVQGSYIPMVTLITIKRENVVEIKIIDNGSGIAPNSIDKIFQPFYTTKPTGQGTGLGLSMSYDIVTKGHHGELKVNSIEGEGAEFQIWLPTNSKP